MELETITLAQDWTYRTPLVTVDYTAGTHSVLPMIAQAARDAGMIEQENSDGDANVPPAPRKARAANPRKG